MFKKTLLLLGVMSFASSAMAMELTNPFYVPAKGQVASTTSYNYGKESLNIRDTGIAKGYFQTLKEDLSFGLTDNWSLDGSISNTWTKETFRSQTDRDDMNVDWKIGTTYNVLSDSKAKLQVSAAYGQSDLSSFGPDRSYKANGAGTPFGNDGTYKYVQGQVKGGYDLGMLMPYAAANIEAPVFQSSDGNNQLKYGAEAGAYKLICNKLSLDGNLRYDYDKEYKVNLYTVNAEVGYYFTPKWVGSVYGSYVLDGNAKERTDIHGNIIGLRLRTAF